MRNTLSRKSRDNRLAIVFDKLHFQNIFHPHENEKPEVLEYSGMKSVFEKHHFGDGLVLKLRFQILPAYCGRILGNVLPLSENYWVIQYYCSIVVFTFQNIYYCWLSLF